MDLTRIEARLNEVADVVLADPRSLRQVVKHHRDVAGLVPHTRCYAITKRELVRIGAHREVRLRAGSEKDWVFLVARPSPREMRRTGPTELEHRVLRAAFHASVHRALEQREARGELDDDTIRARVEGIGRTEFVEIRRALAHDDLLLPPATDREVYVELCALYLELREFAPALLVTTFPGLRDHQRIEQTLARDLDVDALLQRGAPAPPSAGPPQAPSARSAAESTSRISTHKALRLLHLAERAHKKDDPTKSMLAAARATRAEDSHTRARAEEALSAAAYGLAERIDTALRGSLSKIPEVSSRWAEALTLLALRSIDTTRLGTSPEAKTLFALQRAAAAYERPGIIVDVPSWILSRGRIRIVRPRNRTRELQVAQIFESVTEQAQRVRLTGAERSEVIGLIEAAGRQAEDNVRAALEPQIAGVLRHVGLAATSGPERQARSKLVEELLDRIVEHGFFSLPQLRDAISRNEIKLRDLSGVGDLTEGDPLLSADAQLSIELDGIYRRGDVYLRLLQKASSLPFGTRIGRAVTLFFVLPVLGSFILLEGIRYIVGPVLVWFGAGPIEPLTWASFLVTAVLILALVHSEPVRTVTRQVLDILGVVLAWVLFRIPRAILSQPVVQRTLARPAVRGFLRRVLLPAAVGAIAAWTLPLPAGNDWPRVLAGFGVFAGTSAILGTRLGWWVEDVVVDRLAPTWQVLSRHWLPQMLRLIGRTFAVMMDRFERGIQRIDDVLRFRRSDSRFWIGVTAVTGSVWSVVSYVVRLYMTLLVEPEINPLKHFPVVTVSHKMLLPFTPELFSAFDRAFSIFGNVLGGAITGVTVFLLPSVFGFLAWELKENYRLYRATRPRFVGSARVGPHGETMQGMLVAGIHSGTLPKLYERLRRAAQRHDAEAAKRSSYSKRSARFSDDPELGRFQQRLRAAERAVRRFVERELLPCVSASPRWRLGQVVLARLDLSSNRIRIQLRCGELDTDPCELTIEQLGGWLVAGISRPGFVETLDAEQARLFENALAVFYHRAEVEIVREQVEHELGESDHYDLVEEGLVVWPSGGLATELVYPLSAYRPKILKPKAHSRDDGYVPLLDSRRVLLSHQRVAWLAWEHTWTTASQEDAEVPRLLMGPSLLPS